MSPLEFIGRCIDAAMKEHKVVASRSIQVAGHKLRTLDRPLHFDFSPFYISIEVTEMHEMLLVHATANGNNLFLEASMVASSINKSVMAHWLTDECDPDAGDPDDMVLFRLMTQDYLDFLNNENYIQR